MYATAPDMNIACIKLYMYAKKHQMETMLIVPWLDQNRISMQVILTDVEKRLM